MNSILKTEEEITASWIGSFDKPVVSIVCTCFNQEKYIADCIDGFLIQKTTFPFEILVHDDASTDDTLSIVTAYREKYPNIIRVCSQTENQYSKGVSVILLASEQARGKFVALCEGDDYWLSENKLSEQYTALMHNENCRLVVSPGFLNVDGRISRIKHCYYGDEVRFFSAQDVLNINGQFAPTASYLLRKADLIDCLSIFGAAPISDLFIEIYTGSVGNICYVPLAASAYRVQADNSWSKLMRSDIKTSENYVEKMEVWIRFCQEFSITSHLVWDRKLAVIYLGLAVAYLDYNNYTSFRNAIRKSCSTFRLGKKQNLLYIFGSSRLGFKVLKTMVKAYRSYNEFKS